METLAVPQALVASRRASSMSSIVLQRRHWDHFALGSETRQLGEHIFDVCCAMAGLRSFLREPHDLNTHAKVLVMSIQQDVRLRTPKGA